MPDTIGDILVNSSTDGSSMNTGVPNNKDNENQTEHSFHANILSLRLRFIKKKNKKKKKK